MVEQETSKPTPKRIWLLLGEGEEGWHLWSDDPDPSGTGETEAVEYIRVDVAAKKANKLADRLQAITDWCDLALTHKDEFDKHGVKNLEGPVFDAARAVLAQYDSAKP